MAHEQQAAGNGSTAEWNPRTELQNAWVQLQNKERRSAWPWLELAKHLSQEFELEAQEQELKERPWKAELLPKLAGLALVPVGENKRPVDPETGHPMQGWNTASYTPQQIYRMNGCVQAVGFRPGPDSGFIACLDLDGASAIAWVKEFGADPNDAGWKVERENAPDRVKIYFRIPEEHRALLCDDAGNPIGKRVITTTPGEQVELFYGTGQTVVAGHHPSGVQYRSEGHPELVGPPSEEWMAVIARMLAEGDAVAGSTSDLSETEFYQSGPATPCPICGRGHSGACTVFIDGERKRVNCHHGQTCSPPMTADMGAMFGGERRLEKGETITGADGRKWAFVGEGVNPSIGTFSTFVLDRPMPAETDDQALGGECKAEKAPPTFSKLMEICLEAIVDFDQDSEMAARAELSTRFRRTDEQVNAELFRLYTERKIKKVDATDDSVDLGQVEQLEYRMDGWIPKGNTCLTFGSSVSGKTTLEAWKAWHLMKGENILDRETPCEPGKVLFIATDSGAQALKKTFFDVGFDLANHPFTRKGPERRLWIWAHAPEQGQASWVCDLRGVIQLAEFVEKKGIDLVIIDSAKSVAAAGGWNYSDNNAVRAMLRCMREVVCEPTGCCVDFINHDGREAGAAAGAKSWKEDVSMSMRLEEAKDDDGRRVGTKLTFTKDRAAHVDPHRSFVYGLGEEGLTLTPGVETVGTARDVILNVLWSAKERGKDSISTKDLQEEALINGGCSSKTVRNTTGQLKHERLVVQPRRGFWGLAPAEVQRRLMKENQASPLIRVGSTGGQESTPLGMTTLSLCPDPQNRSGHRDKVHVLDGSLSTEEGGTNETPGEPKGGSGQTSEMSTQAMYFVPTPDVGTLPGQGEIPVTAKGVHVCPPDSHTDLLEEEEDKSPERPKDSNWKAAYPETPEGLAKLEDDIAKAGGQQMLAIQLGLSEKYGRQRINDWKRKIKAAVSCLGSQEEGNMTPRGQLFPEWDPDCWGL